MPKVVHKFEILIDDVVTLYLPPGAQILKIDVQQNVQQNRLFAWALVDRESCTQLIDKHMFHIVGTGHEVRDAASFGEGSSLRYLTTVITGALVFHVFEVQAP